MQTNLFNNADESTTVLQKAEGEYHGHRSLLMRTRGLLSTMQRQDVLDRYVLSIFCTVLHWFSCQFV
jgi:hypothetical protein